MDRTAASRGRLGRVSWAIGGNGLPLHQLGLIILAFVGVAAGVLLLGSGRRPRNAFHARDYQPKPLLSAWELRALAEIRMDLPAGYYACPQVRVADLVRIKPSDISRRQSALNYVGLKSVDFAIIDEAGRVVLVVELDDKSHDRADRQQRDRLVDQVLRQCGIPIEHVCPGQRIGIRSLLPSWHGPAALAGRGRR